ATETLSSFVSHTVPNVARVSAVSVVDSSLLWTAERAVGYAMLAQKYSTAVWSRGAAEDRSPWRKPWERSAAKIRAPEGRKSRWPGVPYAPPGLIDSVVRSPTAYAVGYGLSPLTGLRNHARDLRF